MTIIPSSYARVPLHSQDVRVHAHDNDVLAFKLARKTSIRAFFGRKIAFLTKHFSRKEQAPPLPSRGERLKARTLLSPQQSRRHIAEQFARSFVASRAA